jgi:GTP-binding protein
VFVDQIRVIAKAGDGGNGVVSFRREKHVPRGGPDGGDGAEGGSVILRVDRNTDNLKAFSYDPKMFAKDGGHGRSYKRNGKNGKDFIGRVPPGTVIYKCDAATVKEAADMEKSDEGVDLEPVADLVNDEEEFVLCAGGHGGKGNFKFRSATNQTPEEFTLGTDGEGGIYYLELRRIADAGMVGFPNAGKSTLTGKLSAAEPKVGAYPFTTLAPTVGVVEFGGFMRCTVADIPGLIEGAHENRGLGHEFLRHITRCSLLLFVVDMAGSEGRDPISDVELLRTEIKLYDEELAQFPWIVIANKMDLDGADEHLANFRQRFPKVEVVPISAQEEEGLDTLREVLCKRVGKRADL